MPRTRVEVYEEIFKDHNEVAGRVLEALEARGCGMVNVLGSPGAGKTSFLVALIRALAPLPCSVVEGDLESDIDAVALRKLGIDAHQINTHGTCHLDAIQVEALLPAIPAAARAVFIENVGNLICPVSFWLGEKARVLVASTTEGSDKPHKYPPAFAGSDLVVVNKVDLAEVMEFDRAFFERGLRAANPKARIVYVSSKHGTGIPEAAAIVRELLARKPA